MGVLQMPPPGSLPRDEGKYSQLLAFQGKAGRINFESVQFRLFVSSSSSELRAKGAKRRRVGMNNFVLNPRFKLF